MTPAHEPRLLGEYQLEEIIAETPVLRRWLANQISVARRVRLDELKPGMEEHRASFLADVKAKAAVDHPLIASVYEAVAEPGQCYFAHELLPGATLEDRKLAAAPFQPLRLAHLLRRIAEAEIHHEQAGRSTDALAPANIHVDEQGVVRLDNLARSGARSPEESRRDITCLGNELPCLVATSRPGATRMLTLLGWMRGEGVEAPIEWSQIRDIAAQIELQLTEPAASAAPTQIAQPARKTHKALWLVGAAVAAVTLGFTALIQSRPKTPPRPPEVSLPDAIPVPAGNHPTPDGTRAPLPAFRIASHEVTIGEYAAFLETLETLAQNQRERIFDHDEQPAEKTSHQPEGWKDLLAAAKRRGSWQGHTVTEQSPVVGVDWWDAAAYAEWKQARLPTQEEWFAALRAEIDNPSSLTGSGWTPVTDPAADRGPKGLTGMAGSVCEWTAQPAADPANPHGERKWLLIGGSFLKPGSNALTREWTADRSLRRADLGFRVVFDAP